MILFFENFIIIILLRCSSMFVRTIIIIKRVSILALLVFVCYWKYKFLEWNCYFSCIDKMDGFLRERNVIISGVFWFLLCKDTKQLKVVIIVHYHFWYLVMFFLNKNITLWKKYENQTLQTDIDFQFFTWNNYYSSCDSQYWNT